MKAVCPGKFYSVDARVSVLADGQAHNGAVKYMVCVKKTVKKKTTSTYYYMVDFDEEHDDTVRHILLFLVFQALCSD